MMLIADSGSTKTDWVVVEKGEVVHAYTTQGLNPYFLTKEDILEIRRYGKKMNSLMIFYMLLAVVMPSLGITIFIVITGFLNISINLVRLLVLNVIILGIQLLFLGIIKNIRPTIDL